MIWLQEWRHAHGMRCLGIPNTAHFANVTSIKDAKTCKYWMLRHVSIEMLRHVSIEMQPSTINSYPEFLEFKFGKM